MNKSAFIVTVFIGVVIGSLFGWIGCYYVTTHKPALSELSSKISELENIVAQQTNQSPGSKTLVAHEIQLVNENGYICLVVSAYGGKPVGEKRETGAVLEFYNADGRVDYAMGRGLEGGFHIVRTDHTWGITSPMDTFWHY
jgi:hypothetical protein